MTGTRTRGIALAMALILGTGAAVSTGAAAAAIAAEAPPRFKFGTRPIEPKTWSVPVAAAVGSEPVRPRVVSRRVHCTDEVVRVLDEGRWTVQRRPVCY